MFSASFKPLRQEAQEKDFVLRKSARKQEHAKKYQERRFRKLIAVQAGAQDGAKGKKTKTAASRVERPSK